MTNVCHILLVAAKNALAELEGIMPEHDPTGDRWHPGWLTIKELKAAIAGARELSPHGKPIVIEVRGGVVQDVLNVPPGCQYEIRDYDSIVADEEAAGRTA
jgi:hypothetical protein